MNLPRTEDARPLFADVLAPPVLLLGPLVHFLGYHGYPLLQAEITIIVTGTILAGVAVGLIGWLERERSGPKSRLKADAVLALALVHPLAIGRNIPLGQVVEWIVSTAPAGVIEFIPKVDPMVQAMLRFREDVFEDYCEQVFLDSIRRSAQVVKEQEVTEAGRLLVWFKRT